MPLLRKKKKVPQQRRSYFSDQIVQDYSVAQCPCELYFPEPSVKYDEFGALKEVCISGDSDTLQWSKHCLVHLCKIPDVPAHLPIALQDTGQNNEICLNVVLSRSRSGDFSYQIRDTQWHEYTHKVGTKWRRFVLHFDNSDQNSFLEFDTKLRQVLKAVTSNTDTTYLLLAIQTKIEKSRSSSSLNKKSRLSLADLQVIANSPQSNESSGASDSSAEEEQPSPPFNPAPYFFTEDDSSTPTPKHTEKEELIPDFDVIKLCDSLNIHPDELPQTLSSILRSVQGSFDETCYTLKGRLSREEEEEDKAYSKPVRSQVAGKLQNDDDVCLNSEYLPTEELYVPMGRVAIERQSSKHKQENTDKQVTMAEKGKQSSQLQQAQKCALLLQTAISNGDVVGAQEYAKQLAAMKVTVAIDVQWKQQNTADKEKEFSLKVNIEDKDSSGGSISLKVHVTDTIRDLKNKMLLKHKFPAEVQHWIIGKRICADHETLEKCRVKSNGYTAFLYLVSAKSAGIGKEEFERRQALLLNPEFGVGLAAAPQPPSDVSRTPSRKGSSATPGSGTMTAGSASGSGRPKLEPTILEANLDTKEEKKTPAKLQGQPPLQPDRKHLGTSPGRNDPLLLMDKTLRHGGGQNDALRQTGPEIAQILNQIVAPQLGLAVGAQGGIQETPVSQSRMRIPVMHPEENEEPPIGWACPVCTYINQPTRPGCELCSSERPPDYIIPAGYEVTEEERVRLDREKLLEQKTREAQEQERQAALLLQTQNYQHLQQTEALDLIPNHEVFTCPICFEDVSPGDGVVLRECLHPFCKDCLRSAIQYNEEPVMQCPFQDEDYACDGTLQDREIKALVGIEGLNRYLARGLATAESQATNSFHCKTADCQGWCIYEDHVNFFVCQVCGKENCLTCKAIHQGMNCKQYQDDLKMRAMNDEAANQTQIMIKKMLSDGDAMNCPQCRVIVMKKEGCDWIQCSICKTEICWVTKQRRWGPLGNGDISGGCQCRVNGEMCHPDCNNCH